MDIGAKRRESKRLRSAYLFLRTNADKLIYGACIFLFSLLRASDAHPFGLAYFLAFEGSVWVGLTAVSLSALFAGAELFPAAVAIAAFKALLFRDNELRPLLKICLSLTVSALMCLLTADGGAYGVSRYIVSVAAMPLFTALYSLITPASSKSKGAAYQAGLAALLFTVSYGIDCISPWLASLFVLLVTLWAAREGGMQSGGMFGFVCGLACGTGYAAAFGVCGLVSGLVFDYGKLVAAYTGVAVGFCTGLYFFGLEKVWLELFCFALGLAIYCLFEKQLHFVFSLKSAPVPAVAVGERHSVVAEALSSIARSAISISDGNGEAAEGFISVSELIRSAEERKAERCRVDPALSDRAMLILSNAGIRAKTVTVSGASCKKLIAKGVALDELSLSADELCRVVAAVLGTPMKVPQFVMENGSTTLLMESAPRFRVECARTGISKKGEAESGDTVSFFDSGDGIFHALLSDGMGSGKEASDCSQITATFLEKLLRVGADRESTVALLNRFLAEREGECFSTVDLLSADLYGGEAVLLKAGAAPSFLMRGGACKRIQSPSCPVGIISDIKPEQLSFVLRSGDTVVLLSDGLAGEDGSADAAYRLLRSVTEAQSSADIANALLSSAIRLYGRKDDMSVAVIKFI